MSNLRNLQYCLLLFAFTVILTIIIVMKTYSGNISYNFSVAKDETFEDLCLQRNFRNRGKFLNGNESIRIAAVSCGEVKINETVTMVKSAIVQGLRFNIESLEMILFADIETMATLEAETAPSLRNVDKLLYVDSDVIFVRDLREIWSFFGQMSKKQHTGLIPEHENPTRAWYGVVRESKTPFYPPLGLNAGVMLMDLEGQRAFGWEEKVIAYYHQYKDLLSLADQDILNVIFHFHPDTVYVLPCAFNYRQGHCDISMNNSCPSVKSSSSGTGVRVIHGNNWPVHFQDPFFAAIYSAFHEFNLATEDLHIDLYGRMQKKMTMLRSLKSTDGIPQDCSGLINLL